MLIMLLPLPAILFLSFLLASVLYTRLNNNITEARNPDNTIDIDKEAKKSFYKTFEDRLNKNETINTYFSKLQIKLDKLGNPYHLTPLTYWCIKVLPTLIILLLFIYSGTLNLLTILLPILVFFLVDIQYYRKNKKDEAEIRKEFPTIYSFLEIQSYTDIPPEKSLLALNRVVKNKRLHNAIIEMSAEIIAKKDRESALRNFERKFKMQEIYLFTLTIEQAYETGTARAMFGNQREFLNKTYLHVMEVQTANNEIKYTMIIILEAMAVGIIAVYSILASIIQQFNYIGLNIF